MNKKYTIFVSGLLSFFSSLWKATVLIASGIATFFILAGSLFYLRLNEVLDVPEVLNQLWTSVLFFIEYWKFFWLVFFILYFYLQLKELLDE